MPVVNLPTPPGPYSAPLLSTLFRTIGMAMARVIATDEPVTAFLMKSANGTLYRVTISDAGLITTSAV